VLSAIRPFVGQNNIAEGAQSGNKTFPRMLSLRRWRLSTLPGVAVLPAIAK
jgi:hypothetical protein